VILGGGVAVCSLLSAHRAVIFAIAQLSCFFLRIVQHDRNHILVTIVNASWRAILRETEDVSPITNNALRCVSATASLSCKQIFYSRTMVTL